MNDLTRVYYTTQDLNEILYQESNTSLNSAKQLLKQGVRPNSTTAEVAILRGYPRSFIQTLYKLGVNPSKVQLYTAVSHGHQDIVKFLLKYIQPTEEDLQAAIRFNYKPIIQLLLKQVQPTEKSMYLAIYTGNKALVKKLIQKGIRPTFTHLELASMSHQTEIAKFLESVLMS